MALDETLREAIRASGIRIGTLARETRLSSPNLYAFARGQADLTLRTANVLAEYFHLRLMPVDDSVPTPKRRAGTIDVSPRR
ncbi:MAG TPA: helix-turn-helix transcriptional regulator [Gemmataceae bacterium]|jgi:predicted transcriptional regulator